MSPMQRIWSILNNLIELITGIGLVIFITRSFTITDTGNWFLFIALFALISGLRDALIQSALIKSTVDNHSKESCQAIKTTIVVILMFECTTGLFMIASGWKIQSSFSSLLYLYPLYSFPNAFVRLVIFYLRGQLKIKNIFIINLLLILALSISLLLIKYFALPLKSILFALSASNFLAVGYSLFLLPLRSISKASFSFVYLKLLWQYGKFGMLREAVSSVSSRISLFFSSSLLGLNYTALLGVSQRFSQLALLPNNAFQSILFPLVMKAANVNNKILVKQYIKDSLAHLLSLTLPMALLGVIISPTLLELVSGYEYRSGWGLLSIYLLISTILTPFGTAFGSLVTALGKPSLAFKIVLVNSVANITLSYVLLNKMGVWGAPLSLLITEIIGFYWISKISFNEINLSFIEVITTIPTIYLNQLNKIIQFLRKLKNEAHYIK